MEPIIIRTFVMNKNKTIMNQFPLSVPNKVVSEFMRLEVYDNKDNFYPTPRGVMYMSGERKRKVFKAMIEIDNWWPISEGF